MSNKKELGGAIAIGGLIVVGAWLLAKFFESLARNVVITRCGYCNFTLRKRYEQCPNCGSMIAWENPSSKGVRVRKEKLDPFARRRFKLGVSVFFGSLLLWVILNPICQVYVFDTDFLEPLRFLTYASFGYIFDVSAGSVV